jgi:hypothetical protein
MLWVLCGQKNSLQRIFIKKCLLFMVGSVCCVKQQATKSLWTKELTAKDIHKEMFALYGGTCLLRKAVQPCWQTFRQ